MAEKSKYDHSFEHGWKEARSFCPDDALLRKAGWKIAHRPKAGPALWERDGRVLEFAAALAEVKALTTP